MMEKGDGRRGNSTIVLVLASDSADVGKLRVWQRNEQKPIKHSEKLIYSARSRPTVRHRIMEKDHARTSTKLLCRSSKRLLKSIKP
jgi:hypothetical protein